MEGSPVSSDPDLGSRPPNIRPGIPVEETSPISSEGSGIRPNGRNFTPPDDFDRPRRPPQTPPEPSPEGDLTPIGDRSPLTPTFGRHTRGPRTPEGPSPPSMDRNSRLCQSSPPPSMPYSRVRGAPRTPEGSPLSSLNDDLDEAVVSSQHRSRDRHGTCSHTNLNASFSICSPDHFVFFLTLLAMHLLFISPSFGSVSINLFKSFQPVNLFSNFII